MDLTGLITLILTAGPGVVQSIATIVEDVRDADPNATPTQIAAQVEQQWQQGDGDLTAAIARMNAQK